MIKRAGYIVKFYNGQKLVSFKTRSFASCKFSKAEIKKRMKALVIAEGIKHPVAIQYLNDKKIMEITNDK
jgi:hypothetical protein